MTGIPQPLENGFAIVDPSTGRPTLYFIKWAQQRQIDISAGISLQDLQDFLAAHPLIAGSGIGLSPSGNIGADVTISAQVQAILNQISTTRGTVLFRGVANWQGLAPGTAGHFLQTSGAGADPVWAAGGGGGGMTLIGSATSTGASATLSVSGIPATYQHLRLMCAGRSTLAGTVAPSVALRFNADAGANYEQNRWNRFGNVDNTAATSINLASVAAAGITANRADPIAADVVDYAGVTFARSVVALNGSHDGANRVAQETAGWWVNTAAAINQVEFILSGGLWVTGSKLWVYGY